MAANDRLLVPFSEWDDADRRTAAYLPEGEYKFKVVSTEIIKTGPNSQTPGTPGLLAWLEVASGPLAGASLPLRVYTGKSTLWKFAEFLRAVKVKVTQNDLSLPTNQLVGRVLMADVRDGDEYKGKPKSEVTNMRVALVEAPSLLVDDEDDNPSSDNTDYVEQNISEAKADAILGNADDWSFGEDVEL